MMDAEIASIKVIVFILPNWIANNKSTFKYMFIELKTLFYS